MSGIVLLTFVWIAAVVSAQYTALIDLPSGQKLVGAGATFGPQTVNLVGFTKLFDPESACSGLNSGSFGASEIALVLRGNCSFSRKAMNAQQAGAVAVIVINYEDAVFSMTPNASETYSADFQIPAVMISSSQGDTLRALSPNDKVTIRLYKRSPWDWSIVFLFLIGVITIVAGAYWSSAVERAQSYSLPAFRDPDVPNEDVAHMNSYAAFGFIIFASAGLLLMYFFIDKLIYVLLGIFAIGGANSLILSLSPLVRRLAPGLNQKISLRFLGEVEKTSIFLFPLCFGLAIWWVIERKSSYAWVLQDILGIALLLSIQRTLRLSSIKVSSILLCLAFVYDIFWVFLSPYFFAKSVMVTVATGGDTGEAIPMLIQFPRLNDEIGGYSLLGLGDIALPGLFISFMIRFDYKKRLRGFRGYFLIVTIGYAFGLILTDIALIVLQMGQPALLYLVPCTLGVVCLLAWRRGHLKELWNGHPAQDPEGNEDEEEYLTDDRNA